MLRCLMSSVAAVTMITAALTVVLPAPAAAQHRRDGDRGGPRHGYVTAESRWGNGHVSGAVRPGRFGPEVQLPGGSWIHCVRSCSETLRKQTVDFWKSHGNDAPDGGPGYFQWDWRF